MDRYEVTWVDSHSIDGWNTRSDMEEHAGIGIGCKTIGYLYALKEDRVILTMSENVNEQWGHTMTIPRVAVIGARKLV